MSQGRSIECNRIADVDVRNGLDTCKNVTHLSCGDLVTFFSGEQESPYLLDLISRLIGHQADDIPALHGSIKDPAVDDRSTKRIVLGIEDQGSQRSFRIPFRRRDSLYNGLQNLFDPYSFFGRAFQMS